MSSTKQKKNPLLAMTAGCIAGGIEATAVWPMEYIKVWMDNEASRQGLALRRAMEAHQRQCRLTCLFILYLCLQTNN